MSFTCIAILRMGSFGREEGDHKKDYSVFILDNVNHSGRPLKQCAALNNS